MVRPSRCAIVLIFLLGSVVKLKSHLRGVELKKNNGNTQKKERKQNDSNRNWIFSGVVNRAIQMESRYILCY